MIVISHLRVHIKIYLGVVLQEAGNKWAGGESVKIIIRHHYLGVRFLKVTI